MDAVEDFIPLLFMLLDRNAVFLGKSGTRGGHGFLAVDPRSDKCRHITRHILTLLGHLTERINGTLGRAANLACDIPSAERRVFGSVVFPDFIYDIFVVLDFPGHIARIPIFTRVIETVVIFHAVFVSQTQEHVEQVCRWHVTAFAQQIFRRISHKLTVAAAASDDSVDTKGLHILEILVPLCFPPVLVRYIMGDLVKECSCNRQTFFLDQKLGMLAGQIGSRKRGIVACLNDLSIGFLAA